MEIFQLKALSDNYIYILRDPKSQLVGVVDPSEAEPVLSFLREKQWKLGRILNTHHHWDHVGGNEKLKSETGSEVIGYRGDQHRIPVLDRPIDEGRTTLLNRPVEVLFIPGHTLGHIAYWFYEDDALFCGDTLFTLGCGRLFEGTAQMMWDSLSKLRRLPPQTRVFCGHEYTQINGAFALTVEPGNFDLKTRMDRVLKLRQYQLSTVPSTMEEELKTNPFLRPESPEIISRLKLENRALGEVFTEIRKRKDQFRY